MAKRRLLKDTIKSIVRSIVKDIPQVDHYTAIQDYFNRRAKEELPEVLRADEFRDYLRDDYVSGFNLYVKNAKFKPTPADHAYAREQKILANQQWEKLAAIESSLTAEFKDCRYVEVFAERFPEFVKYLPVEEAPVVNLPAIQLKETLTSLGWPKSDEGK